jgi:hypothetical protein
VGEEACSGLLARNKICFKPLSIASVSPDTAASFNKNAEPVNTDSSHRSSRRATILMTGLALASFCRQDEGTMGAGEEGECHMNAEDPQRTSLKHRASNELVKFAAASLAPPAQVERQSCHP